MTDIKIVASGVCEACALKITKGKEEDIVYKSEPKLID